jgi:hypothetical protein
MRSITQRFNAGFGVDLVRLTDPEETRRDSALGKVLLSVPIVGSFMGIIVLMERSTKRKRGYGVMGVRGFLYGSIVGIPMGLALDIVGTIIQVKALVQAKREARREQELRPVGF